MSRIKILIEEKNKIIVCLFFAVFLCISITVFRDYALSGLTPHLESAQISKSLLKKDFGIFKEINIKDTLKEKLDVNFKKFKSTVF